MLRALGSQHHQLPAGLTGRLTTHALDANQGRFRV